MKKQLLIVDVNREVKSFISTIPVNIPRYAIIETINMAIDHLMLEFDGESLPISLSRLSSFFYDHLDSNDDLHNLYLSELFILINKLRNKLSTINLKIPIDYENGFNYIVDDITPDTIYLTSV